MNATKLIKKLCYEGAEMSNFNIVTINQDEESTFFEIFFGLDQKHAKEINKVHKAWCKVLNKEEITYFFWYDNENITLDYDIVMYNVAMELIKMICLY